MSSPDYGLLAPIWAGRPVATVTGDPALVDAMIEAELALARAQGTRLTPPILDAAALTAHTRDAGNPIPALLAALDDPRLHRGATSQDILDTALMLTARRALTLTALDLDTAIAATARLATDHRDTPMTARTLTQQAVPTTFGLKAAGWHHLLTTARNAVTTTAKNLPAQLGGAAGTLASFVALAEADVPYAPQVRTSVSVFSSGQEEEEEERNEGTGSHPVGTAGGEASSAANRQGDASADAGQAPVSSSRQEERNEGTGSHPVGTPAEATGSSGQQAGGVAQAAASSSEQQRPGATARLAAVAGRTGSAGTSAQPPAAEQPSDSSFEQQLPVSSSSPRHPADAHLLTDSGLESSAADSGTYAGVELLTDSAASPPDPGAVPADGVSVQSPADSALALVGRFARILGLAEPPLPWHVLRTPIADLASTLALVAGALGKVAADVLVMARTEVGEVSEGAGGVSSTMPHKANPVRAVLIAGAARQVPALASVLFASVAAEDERPAGAWHAEWQPLREALRLVGGSAATAAELLTGLRVHPDRMAENLALLDLAEARKFTGRDVTDPREYLGAASALVDRALKESS